MAKIRKSLTFLLYLWLTENQLETAKSFFEAFSQSKVQSFQALPQSGSARKNYIAKNEESTFVVTENSNIRENETFLYFTEIFSEQNLNTPKIYKISQDRTLYIQEFLGKETLSEIIANEGLSERTKNLVKKTLEQLFILQNKTKGKIDFTKTFEYERYDELPILHDLNYFKFMFVDVLELPYHKTTLLKEFQKLAKIINDCEPKTLMIRDFQARNIMVNSTDEISFIDYQSAMEGPAMYDVVSFLYQAKANFPEIFREEMLGYYYAFFNDDEEIISKLKNSLMPIRLIRNLQVLGAYGFRGLVQGKEHFVKSIPQGITNLQETANAWQEMKYFPELQKIIANLVEIKLKNK
ncbi:MAG: phosphotransferase [Cruoricaptor ignavus]|nr:phosphotransferase [Cruoricaptor ignavus]